MAASAHSQFYARESNCWPSMNQSLLKTTLLTAIVIATLCGCTRSPKSFQQMREAEQLNFLRAQAHSAMLASATNDVPQIHDVIEANADTFSGSIEQWRGWVRLNYTDNSGGIQQTNIPMSFVASDDGRLYSSASSADSGSPLLNLQ